MEITLEKIELVKDRTGVSYREAKEALERTDGNVVDAIILIEEDIDVAPRNAAETTASKVVEEIKELVKKGNVTRVVVRKDKETVLNLPVNVGILGVVFVPWAALLSTIAALGLRCNISIVKTDGEEVNIVEKATEKLGDVRENYSGVAGDIREKSSEAVSRVKERAGSVRDRVRGADIFEDDDDYFNFDDDYPDLDDLRPEKEEADGILSSGKDAAEKAEDKLEEFAESVEDKAEEIVDAVKEGISDLAGKAEEKKEAVKETVSDAVAEDSVEGEFEEKLTGFRSRVGDVAADAEANMDTIIDELINDEDSTEQDSPYADLKDLLAEAEKAGEEAEDALRGAEEAMEDAADQGEEMFESTIDDLRQKKRKFRFFN